ncbi:hypothetical protein B1992_03095 [Pseudoxanthomonas broegbernensis]|uniref:Uncharacterized protein n=1 Tax=Pseudoxanthomonas broegbernensis TaxID=83619 RepID=A0A7V8GPK5_9GAMM|nr:hypothetical protein [Pseudoxanthomonas broegbernensis]KAF1687659.1 hypothetical protein B1992_03095 [Pseudoxanthomonas broegbernensis]MBB6064685.1 hypothetical protein [Pseudoxanthomonas broegbernensis]
MRLCLPAACLLVASFVLPGMPAQAADPPPTAYRLEPKKVPDLPEGRAVMVRGKTAGGPHRFYLEHMHMMVPVVVTLRPLQPDARLDLAIGKYPWQQPVRQGQARNGEQVSFRFRTEGEFQVAVSSPDPGTAYKLLVWVGDEVKPVLTPVVVPRSQYRAPAGSGMRGWHVAAAAAVLALLALGYRVLRRKRP